MMMDLDVGGVALPCYVAKPEGKPRGGLVLLHEAFGITPSIKRVCDGFAADGYLVVAPGLFVFAPVERPPITLAQDKAGLDEGRHMIEKIKDEDVIAGTKACVEWLERDGLRVASIGYCWGGSCSYLVAARIEQIKACVCYYGGRLQMQCANEQPKCPTLVHLAKLDRYIPVGEATAAFAKYHPAAEVHVYEADHGFNRDDGPTFNPEIAGIARKRTMDLFAKTIG
jgi:carboxymethylenebutenolidase